MRPFVAIETRKVCKFTDVARQEKRCDLVKVSHYFWVSASRGTLVKQVRLKNVWCDYGDIAFILMPDLDKATIVDRNRGP